MTSDQIDGKLLTAWSDAAKHYRILIEDLCKKHNLSIICGNGTYLITDKDGNMIQDINNVEFNTEFETIRQRIQETCDCIWHCIDADMFISWTNARTKTLKD